MVDGSQYALVNTKEEIVKTQALEMMQKSDMCCCERCLFDVCALVLNQIHSHYVTGRRGEVIGHALSGSHENKTELVVELTKAIERVKNSPMH